MLNTRAWWERGRWRQTKYREERESEKTATGQGVRQEVAKLRASRTANNSAVRMEAVAGNLQAVVCERDGTWMAAPTDGGSGSREPSVYMWR